MLPVEVICGLKPQGMFGAVRKHDVHTGLDLYCKEGTPVKSMTAGTVVDVFQFTGESVGSPWWNDTHAVVVDTGLFTYVYGELATSLPVGTKVKCGSILGSSIAVLKQDKGVTPTCMLHLEAWVSDRYKKNFVWNHFDPCPSGLMDPLLHLQLNWWGGWLIKTRCGYKLEGPTGKYISFFSMAADSKSYCQSKGLPIKYLHKDSTPEDKVCYTKMTGKFLWFDK